MMCVSRSSPDPTRFLETLAGLDSVVACARTFEYYEEPVLTVALPSSGPVTGGTKVSPLPSETENLDDFKLFNLKVKSRFWP